MGRKDLAGLFKPLTLLLMALPVLVALAMPDAVRASELPLAAGSPLAGFAFDDRPLLLPVQRNFQMAMLTASSELGRSCGRMEAYGWRTSSAEQQRVNVIFTNTVDRLRGLGYSIEARAPSSVSHDITLFTADRPDKHFIFMWSAGEIGLVMTLCETSAPVPDPYAASKAPTRLVPQDVVQSKLETPLRATTSKAAGAKFTPVGTWIGSYICTQGFTGGALTIAHLRGENFDGSFHFYPTAKNTSVPEGRYAVSGQYDRESQRILINPGKWIEHPRDYFSTVMVGSFDPVTRTFSAYFQGVNGCTSFEAKYATEDYGDADVSRKTKKSTKKTVKKAAVKKTAVTTTAPATPTSPPAAGIDLSGAPISAPAAATAPGMPVAPTPSTPSSAPPASPAPSVPVPSTPPSPTNVPPALPSNAKPSGSAEPYLPPSFQVASAQTFTPQAPQAPPAHVFIPQAPNAQQAPIYNSTAQVAPTPTTAPTAQYVSQPGDFIPTTPQVPAPEMALPATITEPPEPEAPLPQVVTPRPGEAPQPQMVSP